MAEAALKLLTSSLPVITMMIGLVMGAWLTYRREAGQSPIPWRRPAPKEAEQEHEDWDEPKDLV